MSQKLSEFLFSFRSEVQGLQMHTFSYTFSSDFLWFSLVLLLENKINCYLCDIPGMLNVLIFL